MDNNRQIFVLLPTSLAADAPDLRQKTLKIGMIGRALAIFKIPKVCIYSDDDPRVKDDLTESRVITSLLEYLETPQYLRKLLFSRKPELRYAGLLPPLRTPHHPLGNERTEPGEYREAVVVNSGKEGSLLEIGLDKHGFTEQQLRAGQRITIRLDKQVGDKIKVTPASRADTGEYWGYEIKHANNLADGLNQMGADYKIGTSRHGKNIYNVVAAIKKENPKSMAIAFGGPYAGLLEICGRQHVNVEGLFDEVVNTAPGQGTATVRTEEALLATLALLRVLI